MRIDFLYFADCPSHEVALERLREVLAQEGLSAEIAITEVTSDEAAGDLRFVGSPTIRIDSLDIDPALDESHGFGLACRGYRRPDGRITPLPPPDLIRAALHRAARR
jgi:hypothetical protein